MKYPITILDLESTGTNPKEDRIVEICLIRIEEDGQQTVKRTLVNPGVPIPATATECHNITDDMVKDSPLFRQIAKGVHEFINGQDLVVYNGIMFDIPMLYCELLRAGVTWDYSTSNFIDACVIFKRKEERTLSAAVKFYIGREHIGAHGAEADCNESIAVLKEQLSRYEDLQGKTNKELALFSNYDKEILDISGCFVKDDQGRIVINFGKKHKGELAANCIGYLKWMQKEDFMPDTRKIVNEILANQ